MIMANNSQHALPVLLHRIARDARLQAFKDIVKKALSRINSVQTLIEDVNFLLELFNVLQRETESGQELLKDTRLTLFQPIAKAILLADSAENLAQLRFELYPQIFDEVESFIYGRIYTMVSDSAEFHSRSLVLEHFKTLGDPDITEVVFETNLEGNQDVAKCLDYLRVFYFQIPYVTDKYELERVCLLMALLKHPDIDIAMTTFRTLGAYLPLFDRHIQIADQSRASDLLFGAITDLLSVDSPNFDRRSFGLMAWLRLLKSTSLLPITISWTEIDRCYKKLQEILATGSHEQQKYAISILRHYIEHNPTSLGDGSEPLENIKTQYRRYALLFETLVLSGYLNQAEDCQNDFEALAVPESVLDPSWVLVLLQAIFSGRVLDSIKKIVVEWVLLHARTVVAKAGAQGVSFLHNTFIPWAASGGLYVASIYADETLAWHCYHGDRVSLFLEQTVNAAALEEREQASSIVERVLQYLEEHGSHVSCFARAFILKGVLAGVETSNLRLAEVHFNLLSDIATQAGSRPIARDFALIMIRNMLLYREGSLLDYA